MRSVTVGLLAAVMMSQPAMADSFHNLLVVYRCEVVHRLEQIYRSGDPAVDHNRFIAVTVSDRPQAYVQCIFHDHQTRLYCEASSGFYYEKESVPRTFYQPPETIVALARLGFDTNDSVGNFKIDREVGSPPDFNAMADFILRALHDGYGAHAEMKLRFNAPFAPGIPSACVPVS
jgi:hypothetical protein